MIAEAADALAALRAKLAADADVVSEAGRQKTVEVFGEPLSPRQVVETDLPRCSGTRHRRRARIQRAKLDGAKLTTETLRVPADELAAAHAATAESGFLGDRFGTIRENILRFQNGHLCITTCRSNCPAAAAGCEQRYMPLARIGCCVPGGAAAYPSTVLMTAVPAQAAGVAEIVVVGPPTEFGSYNRELLATCHELGVTEVYRIGGAQAVAAMAYGIEGLPRVDKIVGPGNLFVALAKQHVFGTVDIDSIAGPSEVVVIADESVSPAWVAADLIAQAEHSPGASVLLSWSERSLNAVAGELELAAWRARPGRARRGRRSRSSERWFWSGQSRRGGAADRRNRTGAPAHRMRGCGEALAEQIRNAGATFVGPYSPVPLGDYVAGPSHVLPQVAPPDLPVVCRPTISCAPAA